MKSNSEEVVKNNNNSVFYFDSLDRIVVPKPISQISSIVQPQVRLNINNLGCFISNHFCDGEENQ